MKKKRQRRLLHDVDISEETPDLPGSKPVGKSQAFPSLSTFVQRYIPAKLPMNWHHKLYYDILENKVCQHEDGKLHPHVTKASVDREVAIGDKINKNILMLAPRFHAKSTAITVNYVLWEIYRNPNIRIIIVSANEDIAVSFNRAIMQHLENNELLKTAFGEKKPLFQDLQKWGEKAIMVERADKLSHYPTVTAIGVGGRLISRRADIILCDDIIDMDTARTKQMRAKTKEWFENVLLPILEDDGRLIVAGTTWYRDDIYDHLWSESLFDIRLKLKALVYNENFYDHKRGQWDHIPYQVHDWPQALKAQDLFAPETLRRYELFKNLKCGVLWKDKWSYENLMDKKKNMSYAAFMRQYLNEPVNEEEQIFKQKYVKMAAERGKMKTLVAGWTNTVQDQFNYGHLIVAVGVDLAISQKSKSDKSSIAVWGLTENRDRVLLWIDQGKWTPQEIKMKVVDVYYAYQPSKIMVENIAFQDMIRQDLENDLIPVEGFHTTAGKKFNEDVGIGHMAMMFEQNKVILPTNSPKGDEKAYQRVNELQAQLVAYNPGVHAGDMLMASWFAFFALREFDNKLKTNRGFFQTDGLVNQTKFVRAASSIWLIDKERYEFKYTSALKVFREMKDLSTKPPFITKDERFFIFCTRAEKSIAYIIEKTTKEVVAKLDADMTALSYCDMLERTARYFNMADVVIDKEGEGATLFSEMSRRMYPKMFCMQPNDRGLPIYQQGYDSNNGTTPIAVDWFRQRVDRKEILVRDDAVIKEMGNLISVEGNKLISSFGSGQHIKTLSLALWLSSEFNSSTSPDKKKRKKVKPFVPRYSVFNYVKTF